MLGGCWSSRAKLGARATCLSLKPGHLGQDLWWRNTQRCYFCKLTHRNKSLLGSAPLDAAWPHTRFGGTAIDACRRSVCTLVLAEHNNKNVLPTTFSAIEAAKKFDNPICVLVAGYNCSAVSEQLSKVGDVKHVCEVNHQAYEHHLADAVADLISEVVHKSSVAGGDAKEVLGSVDGPVSAVVATASAVSKDALPRVGAMHDVQPLSEITAILEGGEKFKRPTYAGNAIATVQSTDKLKVVTVRGTSFPPQTSESNSESRATTSVYTSRSAEHSVNTGLSRWAKDEVNVTDKPQLGSAKVVVSGGRALKSQENFAKYVEPLCQKLNAAMGASRAAVDAGFVPNDLQIGQTGKVVAPPLYVAVGISGAIQHVAGMKDSKTIVAINKDPDCPIFEIADYCLVGDLFTILPEFTEKLSQQPKA